MAFTISSAAFPRLPLTLLLDKRTAACDLTLVILIGERRLVGLRAMIMIVLYVTVYPANQGCEIGDSQPVNIPRRQVAQVRQIEKVPAANLRYVPIKKPFS